MERKRERRSERERRGEREEGREREGVRERERRGEREGAKEDFTTIIFATVRRRRRLRPRQRMLFVLSGQLSSRIPPHAPGTTEQGGNSID